ncbi:Mitogen-activated protein kinase 16 [Carex littledalei]|uniref:mitogen-activated protein kinase n=1 Tax=Carex littledalei TaxID=544730 RepID=A0A833RRB3_9POAL|nr:Mitogen-activated protein kinase 16 [Carex littledalei]
MGGGAHSGTHIIGRARRWFRRRSQRVRSALSQETRPRRSHSHSHSSLNSNSISISNSSKQSEFSQKREKPKREKEIVEVEIEEQQQEEEEEERDQQQVVEIEEELGILGLKLIRVSFRWKMAGFETFKKVTPESEFFTEYGEANRYQIHEVIGKGSYGVVAAATDTHTGERVAIKKINDVFEHVSDATRILREIKLLRLLRHPDIVEIKHIMLPPSRREFKDIFVVFELMESDLHQVIKANEDLTPEHHQFFLYQLLRGLKYIHSANVFHRDLKPKNILANADCKLKICDFGLARVSFNDTPSAIFWTDYVATRWYRAPELCGSFFSKYTPAIDIWSIGCIFAEMLNGKPLFPGKNVVHQLDLMTDLLGTPAAESISRIRNEKARRYLMGMRKKPAVPLTQKFPKAEPLALKLLERLLSFDPKDRPGAEEALLDPYFHGLGNSDREPTTAPISKLEFDFERKKLTKDDVRELIYREILEYHPQMLQEYLRGGDQLSFMYPSGVDRFKRQFAHLEEHYGNGKGSGDKTTTPVLRQHVSLPRERVQTVKDDAVEMNGDMVMRESLLMQGEESDHASARCLIKSDSISASTCVVVKAKTVLDDEEVAIDGISRQVAELNATKC